MHMTATAEHHPPASRPAGGSPLEPGLPRAAAALAGASCVAVVFSIAASQILLVSASAALLFSRTPWRFPSRWRWPLAAFIAWTLLSLAFSEAPAAGLPQVKKLLLWSVIAVAASGFRNARQIDWTFRAVLMAGSVAAIYGLVKFVSDYWQITRQGLPFYENYITHQITGFMSHWMTYSGQLMLILTGLAAVILADARERHTRRAAWAWLGFLIVAAALLAAFTRGAWLGALAGFTYLVYSYRKWLVLLIPVGLAALYLAAPEALRKREQSIVDPQTDTSIQSRFLMARAGLAMIADNPLFGVGPERVGPEFERYQPAQSTLPPAWYGHLHNTYFQFAAERGLPGLLFFLWLIFEILRDIARLTKIRSPRVATLARTAVAGTLAMLVLGLFEYNFGDSEVLMLYLFLVSLPMAAEEFEANGALDGGKLVS